MPEHLRHDIGNTKVEIVSFLSHEEGEAMYTQAIESMNGNLDELKDKFCLAFFPMSLIISLPRVILDFEQHEESIGVA